jgi:hypothetical protein
VLPALGQTRGMCAGAGSTSERVIAGRPSGGFTGALVLR